MLHIKPNQIGQEKKQTFDKNIMLSLNFDSEMGSLVTP